MYQDTTWYEGRPQPRRHCVSLLDGTQLPSRKGAQPPPQFSANIRCGQTAGWTKMPLGADVGLGPGDFVFDGDQLPPRKSTAATKFFAHVCCGQTAGWMKTPLGTEVDLYPGHIVLAGTQLPRDRGTSPLAPLFGPCLWWPRSLISATAEILFLLHLSIRIMSAYKWSENF